jgi:CubicO group peptidase (beta-lactamase class C family)
MNAPSRHAFSALVGLAIAAALPTATATDTTVPGRDGIATPSPAAADAGEATHHDPWRSGCAPRSSVLATMPGPMGKALALRCRAGFGAGAHDDDLATAIQQIIDSSIVPGAIEWDCCGLELPPTGVIVGVRVPGRPDIVLASGTDLDGAPLDPSASFSTGALGHSVIAQLGLELVADGTLDPDATIDAWLPASPNATAITVRMLIDGTHGWASFDEILFEQVTADLARHWTVGEALATIQEVPPAAEPGTFEIDTRGVGFLALGYVAERVTGHPLAELVNTHVTGPAGLDHSFLSDGTDLPDDYQHGRFAIPGFPIHSTADAPLTSYFTYAPADDAFVSNVPDLLDLLDTWADGTWRPGATPPAPAAFPADRQDTTPEFPGNRAHIFGLDVPYNGYCPCQPTDDGNVVDAIGRQPRQIGTDLQMLHFLDDDVSIVLHYNSDQAIDPNVVEAVLDDIRAQVAASL